MRIINSYLCRRVLLAFCITIFVSTFVLLMGQFVRVFELLAQGVPLRSLATFIYFRIPQALTITLPLAAFLSTVLVFRRMSEDNEITALRASGISVVQIIAPLIAFASALSLLCFFIQFHLAPEYKYQAKLFVRQEGVTNPLLLLEEGHFVEIFDGYLIYVGATDGNRVTDIHLYVLDENHMISQKIFAASGDLQVDKEAGRLELTLYNTTIDTVDPSAPTDVSRNQRVQGDTLTYPLNFGERLNQRRLSRSLSELRLPQLFARIQIYSERAFDTTPFYAEIHKRAALALSPFSFVLLGIPLGFHKPRKQSHGVLLICILLPFIYYALLSIFESLYHKPGVHPELLMWLPNVIYQISGIFLLTSRR